MIKINVFDLLCILKTQPQTKYVNLWISFRYGSVLETIQTFWSAFKKNAIILSEFCSFWIFFYLEWFIFIVVIDDKSPCLLLKQKENQIVNYVSVERTFRCTWANYWLVIIYYSSNIVNGVFPSAIQKIRNRQTIHKTSYRNFSMLYAMENVFIWPLKQQSDTQNSPAHNTIVPLLFFCPRWIGNLNGKLCIKIIYVFSFYTKNTGNSMLIITLCTVQNDGLSSPPHQPLLIRSSVSQVFPLRIVLIFEWNIWFGFQLCFSRWIVDTCSINLLWTILKSFWMC